MNVDVASIFKGLREAIDYLEEVYERGEYMVDVSTIRSNEMATLKVVSDVHSTYMGIPVIDEVAKGDVFLFKELNIIVTIERTPKCFNDGRTTYLIVYYLNGVRHYEHIKLSVLLSDKYKRLSRQGDLFSTKA